MKRLIMLGFIIISILIGKEWVQVKGIGQECLIDVIASDDFQTSLQVMIPGFYRTDTLINNIEYNILEIPGTGVYLRDGVPTLPAIYKFIAIPPSKGVKVTVVAIEDTFLSNYYLLPAQPAMPDFDPDSFTINDSLYNLDIYFPETLTS